MRRTLYIYILLQARSRRSIRLHILVNLRRYAARKTLARLDLHPRDLGSMAVILSLLRAHFGIGRLHGRGDG